MTRKSKREIEAFLEEHEPQREDWPVDADPFVLREMAGGEWEPIPREVLAKSWENALQPVDNDAKE